MIAYMKYGYDNFKLLLSYDMISYVIYACMISYIPEIIYDGFVISYSMHMISII